MQNSDLKNARGPSTPEGRERALANLRPWMPGESGNPKGRPTFGASVREWANLLAVEDKATLLAIIADDTASNAKVAAAQQVLKAREGDGQAFDRLADRTEGRPQQAVTIQAMPLRSPDEEAAALLAEMRRGLTA